MGTKNGCDFAKKKGGGGSDVHFISYTNTFQLFIKKNNYMKHMTTFCYFLTDLVHQS
jgi:hypothetical protein